jgi:hypothetical protein
MAAAEHHSLVLLKEANQTTVVDSFLDSSDPKVVTPSTGGMYNRFFL